jgi:hypothetical protein
MIFSTNSSSRRSIVGGAVAFLLVSGCAMMGDPDGEPLELEALAREDLGSSPEGFPIIRWTASTGGGSGALRYEFRSLKGPVEIIEQEGISPTWDWAPTTPGAYRIKATVRDEGGDEVESGWSSAVVVRPPIGKDSLIAILPIENLSGGRAPLDEIHRQLRWKLSQMGFRLVEEEALEDFMKRYRIRHTGGLRSSVAQALGEEIGARAYLVTSLEAYQERNRPMVSILSRLVLSGERSEILWMDAVGLSGDGYPGFLGLSSVNDLNLLLERAIHCLGASLDRFLPGEETTDIAATDASYVCDARARLVSSSSKRRAKGRHRPQSSYRGPSFSSNTRYTVALIPFLNLSNRNSAGKIVALHFVNQLVRTGSFRVLEPGILREQLLKYRIIMQAGPSLANAELISSDEFLGVDLVFSGTTFDYQDMIGTPKVDFAVKIIDPKDRKLVWSSRSYNTGDEGVYFFDVGRIYTAHRLASEMAWGTYKAMARGPGAPAPPRPDPRDAEYNSNP